MNALKNDRVGDLFEIAIGFPPADRSRVVSKHANGDQELESEVLRLLRLDEQASQLGFLDIETKVESGTFHDDEPTGQDPYIDTQLGNFHVDSLLAIGGMGRVYVGSRTDGIDQEVAIKVLRDSHADNRTFRMFAREQQVLAKLSHPSIASLIDRGFTEAGQPYFVMPLVKGERIDRYCETKALCSKKIAKLVLRVCQAIDYAHQQSIVHCDVKPSNVLVSHNEIPIVTDFGLAKFIKLGDGETLTQSLAGTPGYMAPEQLGGGRTQLDERVDVYGIGAMLYAILTGRPPHKGNGFVETLALVREAELVPVRKLAPKTPRDLVTICHKCLEKKPTNRYESVSVLADDLERFLRDEPVQARPISKPELAFRWADRNRLSAGLIFFLVGLTIAGLVVTTSLWRIAENRLEVSEQKTAEANQLLNLTFQQAEDFYTQLAIELRDEPAADEFRRSLLDSALKMYQELAEIESDNPEMRHYLARAHWYIGQSLRSYHETEQRNRSIEKALEIFTELAVEFPENHRHRFDMFNCLIVLNEWNLAYDIIQELVKLDVEQPDRMFYRVAFALALQKRALSLVNQGNHEEAMNLTNQSISISRDLIERHGESYRDDEEDVMIVFRKNIANCQNIQSFVHLARRQMRQANESARLAVQEGLTFNEQFPNHEGHVFPIYASAVNIAYFSGDRELAFQLNDELLQFTEQLIRAKPDAAKTHAWKFWKARFQKQRGSLFELDGDINSAHAAYADAVDLFRQEFLRATDSLPARSYYVNELMQLPAKLLTDPNELIRLIDEMPHGFQVSNQNECLGVAHLRLERPQKALVYFDQCPSEHPRIKGYRALALAKLGRYEEAEVALDEFLIPPPFAEQSTGKTAATKRIAKEFKSLVEQNHPSSRSK